MCSCHSILECCIMFSGVKLSMESFVLFQIYLPCHLSKKEIEIVLALIHTEIASIIYFSWIISIMIPAKYRSYTVSVCPHWKTSLRTSAVLMQGFEGTESGMFLLTFSRCIS